MSEELGLSMTKVQCMEFSISKMFIKKCYVLEVSYAAPSLFNDSMHLGSLSIFH